MLDSDAVGVAKPDPANIQLALAAGVRPIHVDPYGFCVDSSHPHAPDLATIAAALLDDR